VTAVSCAFFIIQKKNKRKEKKKKINIKLEKEKKRKRKIVSVPASHNIKRISKYLEEKCFGGFKRGLEFSIVGNFLTEL